MLTSVPNAGERADIVSYLATLPAAPGTRPARPVASVMPAPAPPALRTGPAAMGDYRDDGPGVRRQIKVGDLPSPFATPASRNSPMVADPPAGTSLHAPPGFTARLFLGGLTGPRLMRVAPNGDIFVVESNVGRIRVLRARDGAEQPARDEVFASGLHRPFGVAFFPAGDSPKWVYVANSESVVRFRYQPGDLVATGAPQVIVPKLADSSGGHWTRDVAFSRDGSAMYVSVGSASNVAETVPTKTATQAVEWEKTHALGASWGDEDGRADVLVFDPDGGHRRIFAAGIRNCVGLAIAPTTGDLWCSTNERDGLGDNLVPDYATRVRSGAFYG